MTPPRSGERTLLGVENLLASIAVPEPFALELAGDEHGLTLMARCLDDQVVRGQIATHYPQARIHELPAEEDPLLLAEGEQAWSMTLRASGPEYVSLRVFRDDDLLDAGSDPLLSLLGALSAPAEGERVVARLLLRSLGPEWAQAHQVKAYERPLPEQRQPAPTAQVRSQGTEGLAMAVLAVVGLGAVRGVLRQPQRPRRARSGGALASAGSEGRDAPRGTLRREGAPSLRAGCHERRLRRRDDREQGEPDSLPRRPPAPPPPLRGAHAHGQVHAHAPPRHPQA